MNQKIPFTLQQVEELAKQYPTPFYIYEAAQIERNASDLNQAMKSAGFSDFCNYFAVKALPNPHILKLVTALGQGLDCSSLAELELAKMVGVTGERIMFSSNDTSQDEFARAVELGAIINFDDISLVQPFIDQFGTPEIASCRYNPGNISFEGANESIIGRPAEAKFGMTHPQIIEAYQTLKRAGTRRFGLHAMLLSNDRDYHNHVRIAELLFALAAEISQAVGIKFDFIDLGGGLGVAYRPSDREFDLKTYSKTIRAAYDSANLASTGNPRLLMENGRFITASAGYLVARIINIKHTHKKYIGLDASMANLMRPGMYGAYHHISVLGKEADKPVEKVDVTGPLCENNDKFAIDRLLPKVAIGDFLVIHTAGAHAHAMGFQYNGRLRSAELLLGSNGEMTCIRRAETLDNYFATLSGEGVALWD